MQRFSPHFPYLYPHLSSAQKDAFPVQAPFLHPSISSWKVASKISGYKRNSCQNMRFGFSFESVFLWSYLFPWCSMLLSSVFLQGRKEAGIDNMTRYSTEKRVVEKWLVDAIVLAFSCKFPLSNLTANFPMLICITILENNFFMIIQNWLLL